MGSTIDLVLFLLSALVLAWLLWMERARLLPLVTRPDPTADTNTTPGGYYWKLTRQAGLSPFAVWPYYMATKVVLAVALPMLFMRMTDMGAWALPLAAAGFMLPDGVIDYVRKQRQAKIRRDLSFFLDLLVSLLQAGLGLEVAFARTAREGLPRRHPLANEARRVVEELSLGRDRSVGFQMLADRTGVPELRGLANALGIGLTLGGSVEATLKVQADLARSRRREEGLKQLNVASVQVLVPIMLCGFPVFVVLVLAPLAIKVVQGFVDLGGVLRAP